MHVQVVCSRLMHVVLIVLLSLQGAYESRSIFTSLDIAWGLLRIFPRELLRRITAKTLDVYYDKESKAE